MSRPIFRPKAMIPVVTAASLSLGACDGNDDGDGDGGLASSYCEKLDTCNALEGMSTQECTEKVEKQLDDMTSTDRADTEKVYGDCLEFKGCEAFLECVEFYYYYY